MATPAEMAEERGERMGARAVLWQSRWVHLGLAAALAAALYLLTSGVAGAQAFPPDAKTTQGGDIRALYMIVFAVAAVVFVIVEAAIAFMFLRYRRRGDDPLPPQIEGNARLEVVWTAIPLLIVVVLFGLSFVVLNDVESAADDGARVEEIDVVARQWAWGFNYGAPLDSQVTSAVSNDPAETTILVSNAAPFAPFMTLRIGIEHLRVQEIAGNALTVSRGENGTRVQRHAAGDPIIRIVGGTEVLSSDRKLINVTLSGLTIDGGTF